MTPPVLIFLGTFVGFLLVGTHSVWRFVVRGQLPSLIHAGNAAACTYSAWLVFLAHLPEDPMNLVPKTPAFVLFGWAWASVVGIHLYELHQRVPYDGLFRFWRGKR